MCTTVEYNILRMYLKFYNDLNSERDIYTTANNSL